jgi:hypothetical protein
VHERFEVVAQCADPVDNHPDPFRVEIGLSGDEIALNR